MYFLISVSVNKTGVSLPYEPHALENNNRSITSFSMCVRTGLAMLYENAFTIVVKHDKNERVRKSSNSKGPKCFKSSDINRFV